MLVAVPNRKGLDALVVPFSGERAAFVLESIPPEKHADRRIADFTELHRRPEFCQEPLGDLVFADTGQRLRMVPHIPIAVLSHPTVSGHFQPRSRRKLLDSREHRFRRGSGDETRMVRQPFIDRTGLVGIGEQRLDLGCEGQPTMMLAVIQRLDPDPIANQPQFLLAGIPQGDSEHPAEFVQAFNPPLLEGMEDHFGIGMIGLPAMTAQTNEFGANLGVVIDFAVEDDLELSILRSPLAG